MIVPWNAISSKSVQLFIEQVNIVVSPKGKDEWDVIKDTIQTNADLKKLFIDKFAAKLYDDLIVSNIFIFRITILLESLRSDQRVAGYVKKNAH